MSSTPNSLKSVHPSNRSSNSLAISSPLADKFYSEQLKNRRFFKERDIDAQQRELFKWDDKRAEEERQEEASRRQKLKLYLFAENKKLEEAKHQSKKFSHLREQQEEQFRNRQASKELEEERQNRLKQKQELRAMQAKELEQQMQFKGESSSAFQFPVIKKFNFKKEVEPVDELKIRLMENIHEELKNQIQQKAYRIEQERKSMLEERRRSCLLDQLEKEKDIEVRNMKNLNQQKMRYELERQISGKNFKAQSGNRTRSFNHFGKSSNLPDFLVNSGGKGRGYFSALHHKSRPLW